MKSLSCVRLLVTPWTAAYQAPPSMGFSSQEYWSGVPLPSPKLLHLCPTHCKPMDCSRQGPLPVELSRQEYWSGLPYPPPGDLPNLGIEPGSPSLEADVLTSEPPGKPLYSIHTALLSGEGNGTPLQYSWLENPMDGGAWKAAVH